CAKAANSVPRSPTTASSTSSWRPGSRSSPATGPAHSNSAAVPYAAAPPNPAAPASPAVTAGPDEERARELRARGADMDWDQVIAYTLTQITQALSELESETQP
ncbi:MAG TPA: hypothetical protein VEV61_06550, partial [Streptosporangiaceae bacterium]|nr:hypothetical protein [Streptosporangiaceae bacterium]